MVITRTTRLVIATLVAALALALMPAPRATAARPSKGCAPRILVLAAMPLELNPLLRAATIQETVTLEDRTFYVGRLAGHDVVLAMTRIGLVNATETATLAFEHFGCLSAALFSGVAGSKRDIGDVTIPARWTLDGGETWLRADREMLRTARRLAGTERVDLSREVPVGDAACLCPGVDAVTDAGTPVRVEHQPAVFVGGDGISSDTYGDKALPCVPGGGDVFGCTPCMPGSTVTDALYFASNVPDYLDPAFFQGFFTPPGETTDTYEAQDMESAAVAAVAKRYHVPYLAIRSASDGNGDPLMLPGFPFQFFVYRQLAGNNAAATTIAFLEEWPAPRAAPGRAPKR